MICSKCTKCGEKTFHVDFIAPLSPKYHTELSKVQQAAIDKAHLMGNTQYWENLPLMGYCMLCDYLVVYSRLWTYSVEYNVQEEKSE